LKVSWCETECNIAQQDAQLAQDRLHNFTSNRLHRYGQQLKHPGQAHSAATTQAVMLRQTDREMHEQAGRYTRLSPVDAHLHNNQTNRLQLKKHKGSRQRLWWHLSCE